MYGEIDVCGKVRELLSSPPIVDQCFVCYPSALLGHSAPLCRFFFSISFFFFDLGRVAFILLPSRVTFPPDAFAVHRHVPGTFRSAGDSAGASTGASSAGVISVVDFGVPMRSIFCVCLCVVVFLCFRVFVFSFRHKMVGIVLRATRCHKKRARSSTACCAHVFGVPDRSSASILLHDCNRVSVTWGY